MNRPPVLVAVGGLSGSGKSTLSRALAPHLDAVVLRTDVIRKQIMGVAETDRLGPEGYAPTVTQQTYATLFEQARLQLAAGRNVIADAVFSRRDERQEAAGIAFTANARFCGLWLEVPLSTANERITLRAGDASDATPETRLAQEGRLEHPVTWVKINSDALPLVALTRLALGHIEAA